MITTNSADLEVSSAADVIIRQNAKNSSSALKTRIFSYNTELFSIDEAEAKFQVKLDANVGGLRTKAVAVTPTGGASGDIQIRTDNSRLYVNVAGTWKFVTLT